MIAREERRGSRALHERIAALCVRTRLVLTKTGVRRGRRCGRGDERVRARAQPEEAMAQLEGFAEARRINVNEMKNVVRSLLTVLRGALRKNLLPKAIVDDLGLLGPSCAQTYTHARCVRTLTHADRSRRAQHHRQAFPRTRRS